MDAIHKRTRSHGGTYVPHPSQQKYLFKAIMVIILSFIQQVRTSTGVVSYPVVETVQKDNICHLVVAPAQIKESTKKAAMDVAMKAIATFAGRGIYGVGKI